MKEPLPYFMGLKKQNDASTRLSVVLYKGVAAQLQHVRKKITSVLLPLPYLQQRLLGQPAEPCEHGTEPQS